MTNQFKNLIQTFFIYSMKHILQISLVIAYILFTTSCGQHSPAGHQDEPDPEHHEQQEHHEHSEHNEHPEHHEHPEQHEHPEHQHQDIGLTLDNGNKWKANPETTTGIQNMIRLVHDLSDPENAQAYNSLKTDLEAEFTMIFKKCTMTGEAHNQLHNFLLPMKKMFEGLASDNLNAQQDHLRKLKHHLAEYSNYFE